MNPLGIVCPVCRRDFDGGSPLVYRWRRLLEHLDLAHPFTAEMLAIAYGETPSRHPGAPLAAAALATRDDFYPTGDAW